MKKLLIPLFAILIIIPLSAQELKPEPLVILNGVQTNFNFTKLDPNTIESINVLKGDAAVAIYGPSGKDGVIQIRTKDGQKSGLQIYPDNDPLIILDGIEYRYEVNSIDPNTISSISVLRNSPQTEKYGERGKKGVIIITTKKASTKLY